MAYGKTNGHNAGSGPWVNGDDNLDKVMVSPTTGKILYAPFRVIHAYDSNGVLLWSYDTGEGTAISTLGVYPSGSLNSNIIVVCRQNDKELYNLFCLAIADGKPVWIINQATGHQWSRVTFDGNDCIIAGYEYIPSRGNKTWIRSVDEDGEQNWSYDWTLRINYPTPWLASGGLDSRGFIVFNEAGNGYLTSLNADGTLHWRILGSPAEYKVMTATVENVEIGDYFELCVAAGSFEEYISFTAITASNSDVVLGLEAAWNASVNEPTKSITASASGNVLKLTGDSLGYDYSLSSSTVNGGATDDQLLTIYAKPGRVTEANDHSAVDSNGDVLLTVYNCLSKYGYNDGTRLWTFLESTRLFSYIYGMNSLDDVLVRMTSNYYARGPRVCVVNKDGVKRWETAFYDRLGFEGVAIDSNDNILVANYPWDSEQYPVESYDVDGNLNWSYLEGTPGADQDLTGGEVIAVDSNDNVYVGGVTTKSTKVMHATVIPTIGGFPATYMVDGDVFTLTIDTASVSYTVPDEYTTSYTVAQALVDAWNASTDILMTPITATKLGSIVVLTADVEGFHYIDVTSSQATKMPMSIESFASNTEGAFLWSFTSAGVLRWTTAIGGFDFWEFNNMTIDNSDNLIIAGHYRKT